MCGIVAHLCGGNSESADAKNQIEFETNENEQFVDDPESLEIYNFRV